MNHIPYIQLQKLTQENNVNILKRGKTKLVNKTYDELYAELKQNDVYMRPRPQYVSGKVQPTITELQKYAIQKRSDITKLKKNKYVEKTRKNLLQI